jgi:hypothetical protein
VPEQSDVKVFISWSGDLAKDVAVGLREWLPLLFDRVAPWASDTDIAAGQRGLAQIEAELTDTRFGIVVVTAENQHAPWLNFEAGALSRVVGDVEHRVVPLLVDLSGPTQLTGPLAQFQAKTANRDGTRDLVLSLASVAGIPEAVVAQRFEVYWPSLEIAVTTAKENAEAPAEKPTTRKQADVLDEILLHVRALRTDNEPAARPSSPQPGKSGNVAIPFERWFNNLAAQHNLAVYVSPGKKLKWDEPITLMPIGEYSEEDERAFMDALQTNQFARSLEVDVMPF